MNGRRIPVQGSFESAFMALGAGFSFISVLLMLIGLVTRGWIHEGAFWALGLLEAALIVAPIWRWLCCLEVSDGVLTSKSLFFRKQIPIRGSCFLESAVPWLLRFVTSEGKSGFFAFPDESVGGEPAREILVKALFDQGGQILIQGWHKPLDTDPVKRFRSRFNFEFESFFLLLVVSALSGCLFMVFALFVFLPWWAAGGLTLVTLILFLDRAKTERKEVRSSWRLRSDALTPEEAVARLEGESGEEFGPGDIEGATLLRLVARGKSTGTESRLALKTVDGRIGCAGPWSKSVEGQSLRKALLSAGVPFCLQEVERAYLSELTQT